MNDEERIEYRQTIANLEEENLRLNNIIEEKDGQTDLSELEVQLICEMEVLYNMALEGREQEILAQWRELSDTLNRRVAVKRLTDEVYGIALDIDENGALILLEDDGNQEIITAGDCKHLD